MNTLDGLAEPMNTYLTDGKVMPEKPASASAGEGGVPAGDEGMPVTADFARTLSDQQVESSLPGILQALLGEAAPLQVEQPVQQVGEDVDTVDDGTSVDPQVAYAMAAMGMLPTPQHEASQPASQMATGPMTVQGGGAMATAAEGGLVLNKPLVRASDVREQADGDADWSDGSVASQRKEQTLSPQQHADIQAVLSKLGDGQWAQDGSDAQDVLRALTQEAGTGQFGATLSIVTQDLRVDQVKAPAAGAPVVLQGEPKAWQQPLMQALGDRLQLQIAGRSEQAVIKLSPPMLGQVEIAVQQQGGALQVRLSATHSEVVNQLQQVSDGLRQDLVQRHATEVSVQVTSAPKDADMGRMGQGREGQQQGQPDAQTPQQDERQRRPGRALTEADTSGRQTSTSFAHSMSRVA
jgi:flagellar hook-length control protein FliK